MGKKVVFKSLQSNKKNMEKEIKYDVFISYNSSDKVIADAVCHFIECRKLRCFIAPRDIVPPDWAGSITRAIERSKAFVVIVSENSIASNEVAKEITLATRVSNYIFPFRVENAEMNERMTYHLSSFHWIDAIEPPLEKRINELADRIVDSLTGNHDNVEYIGIPSNYNKGKNRLIGKVEEPRTEFVGREEEILAIENAFEDGAGNVFLTGMGGIGKSEIAKAYAKKHKKKYNTVVFANYESDLKNLICSDQTIRVENLSRAVASGGKAETLDDYYERKMDVLQRIMDEDTLLIIDNFDVESDDEMEAVMSLPCHIIWTTRTDFSSFGCETVYVGPFEEIDTLVNLYQKIDRVYKIEKELDAIKKIIELLEYHTFAVSLTAAQERAEHIKPSEMYERLSTEGISFKTNKMFARDMKKNTQKMTAYMYIEKLFDFSKISDESIDVMRLMGVTPREGVDVRNFMDCAEIDDFGVIDDLITKNWIRYDEENDKISLHMLIHDLVWKRLEPTVENCMTLLKGIDDKVNNAWNISYEENCSMESLVYSVMHAFPNPTKESFDYFENMATFCWIQGNFDLSELYEKKLYKLSCDEWGEQSVHTGAAALRVAAVYHNQADYASARPWYEKGLEIQTAVAPDTPEYAFAMGKVARCYAQNNDLEKAKELYTRAYAIQEKRRIKFEQEGDEEGIRKACIEESFMRQNLGKIYAMQGEADKGYEMALPSYEFLKNEKKESSLVIYAMYTMSYILFRQGKYDEARNFLEECIEQMIYYHGESRIDVLLFRESLGDCDMNDQNFASARDMYIKVLADRERLFPSDVKSIKRLEEKYEKAKAEASENYEMLAMWS